MPDIEKMTPSLNGENDPTGTEEVTETRRAYLAELTNLPKDSTIEAIREKYLEIESMKLYWLPFNYPDIIKSSEMDAYLASKFNLPQGASREEVNAAFDKHTITEIAATLNLPENTEDDEVYEKLRSIATVPSALYATLLRLNVDALPEEIEQRERDIEVEEKVLLLRMAEVMRKGGAGTIDDTSIVNMQIPTETPPRKKVTKYSTEIPSPTPKTNFFFSKLTSGSFPMIPGVEAVIEKINFTILEMGFPIQKYYSDKHKRSIENSKKLSPEIKEAALAYLQNILDNSQNRESELEQMWKENLKDSGEYVAEIEELLTASEKSAAFAAGSLIRRERALESCRVIFKKLKHLQAETDVVPEVHEKLHERYKKLEERIGIRRG